MKIPPNDLFCIIKIFVELIQRNITMEHLLTLVENSEPQVIDEEKLKFFTTKISIWDHFSMHEVSYKCLVFKKKVPFKNIIRRVRFKILWQLKRAT